MGFHRVNNHSRLLILFTKFNAKLNVGSFHLVIHSLTDIMQQAGTLRHPYIQTQLACQKPRQLSHFYGMLQSILSITRPELQLSE